jgi:Asp-tRNA(Asn)/Glu-tRNA(Gln) amidotransferase C subunit
VDLTEEEEDKFSKELKGIIDTFGYEWKLDRGTYSLTLSRKTALHWNLIRKWMNFDLLKR